MIQRIVMTTVVAALGTLVLGTGLAHAKKYDYGRYRVGGGQEQGFFVYVDAIAANPRNTDNVVATFDNGSGSLFPLIPEWDTDFAGRIGFGYQWSSGNKLEISSWGFSTETGDPATGNFDTHFSIGPPICSVDPCAGAVGTPGHLHIVTEITAQTSDLTWGRVVAVTDTLDMEVTVGLRYAYYEETARGFQGDTPTQNTFDANKINEGEMVGVKASVRGTYRFASSFSGSAGLGFSALDGELEASSGLTPTAGQSGLSPSFAALLDDSRSGTIRDFDLAVNWHVLDDRLRLSLGWEQSVWEEIAADLMRNFAGSTVPLRNRDSVAFSGYRLGVYYRF